MILNQKYASFISKKSRVTPAKFLKLVKLNETKVLSLVNHLILEPEVVGYAEFKLLCEKFDLFSLLEGYRDVFERSLSGCFNHWFKVSFFCGDIYDKAELYLIKIINMVRIDEFSKKSGRLNIKYKMIFK